jgi:hypothetical protein
MTALVVTLVGVFAFACLVVLFAYAPDMRGGSDPNAHALSRSAIGYAGFVSLMRLRGASPVVGRSKPVDDIRERGLQILTPGLEASATDVRAALFPNRNLIILPKWDTTPDPLHNGWVLKISPKPEKEYAGSYLAKLVGPVTLQRRKGTASYVLRAPPHDPDGTTIDIGAIDRLQTISGPRLRPLLLDPSGGAVLASATLDHDTVYILADPDLVNTQGLADIRRAAFAERLIGWAGAGPLVFDVTLNGYKRERSLLRLAFDPPFLAVTLCAVAAAMLMGWRAAVRFGPALQGRRAIALGKRALADNSAALIGLARREADMAVPYATQTRAAVAIALGAPPDLDTAELNAFLERLGERRKVKTGLMELLHRSEGVRTPRDLVLVARDLHQWRLEMTRDPG